MHKPLKIVHVLLNYHPSIGGTQWLFKNISEGLVAHYKDEVVVLTVDSYYGPEKKNYTKIQSAEEIINGVLVKRFAFVRWHLPILRFVQKIHVKLFNTYNQYIENIQYSIFSKQLQNTLKTIEADVVCASSSAYSFNQYASWRHQTPKPKAFVSMGAIHFQANKIPLSNKALTAIKHADKYIANTVFEKVQLMQLGVDESKINVIGCGVHLSEFAVATKNIRASLGINENDFVLAFVGRQEPQKKITFLIEAVHHLKQQYPTITLIIAGGQSWYTPTLQSIVEKYNAQQPFIHIINNFSEADKVNIYHACNAFVSASDSESFGIVFIEAWACKKPVIAANVGAIASVVTNEYNGLLFEVGKTKSLEMAITKLINNHNLQQYLANNGYNTVKEKYTWPVIIEKYRATYQQAIKQHNPLCVE